MKNLAQESLELLRVALFDRRFPALFSLDVFGNIVGIFELNNLGLVVPSPLLQWLDLAQDSGEESAAGSSAPGVPADLYNSCSNMLGDWPHQCYQECLDSTCIAFLQASNLSCSGNPRGIDEATGRLQCLPGHSFLRSAKLHKSQLQPKRQHPQKRQRHGWFSGDHCKTSASSRGGNHYQLHRRGPDIF